MSKHRDAIAKAAVGRTGEEGQDYNYLDKPSAPEVMTEEQFERMAGGPSDGIKSALLVAMASMLESDGFVPNSIEFSPDAKRENLEIKIVGTIMVSKEELALVLGQPTPQAEVATAGDGDQPDSE
jgi:hypothetical protein